MSLKSVKTIETRVVVLIAGVVLTLTGCSHLPAWFPHKQDRPAPVEPEPVASESEPEPESPAEPEPQPIAQPPEKPVPEIAIGDRMHDERYAELSARREALAPEEVGYFIDVHEARLRQVLAGTRIQMQRNEGQLLLTVPGNLSFETNSAQIVEAARPVLGDIAAVLVEFDKTLVSVRGYTDDRGDAEYNRLLSERRAVAVAMFLARNGVAKQRLVGIGYGEDRPVIDSDTEAARTANRRIEILIEPLVRARASGPGSPA